MARRGVRLTDAQWAKIEPHLPRLPRTRRGGRPWIGNRAVIDGILWVLKTGARWCDLPSGVSESRRRAGVGSSAGTKTGRGSGFGAHSSPSSMPAGGCSGRPRSSMAPLPRQKGGSDIGPTKRGKGTKCMVLVERQGVPLGICLASASPAEITLLDANARRARDAAPAQRRIAWSVTAPMTVTRCARRLRPRGIVLISPYRSNNLRQPAATKIGGGCGSIVERWIIERTIAWFGAFRRLLIRHERSTRMFLAFFQFAAALIVLRRLCEPSGTHGNP